MFVTKVDLLHVLHRLSVVVVQVSDMVHVPKRCHGLLDCDCFFEYHVFRLSSSSVIFVVDDPIINVPDLKGQFEINLTIFEDQETLIVVIFWRVAIKEGYAAFFESNIL